MYIIIFSFLKCVFCYFWISIAKCAVFFQELRSAIVCWRVRTPTLEIFWSSFSLKAAATAAMLMLGRSESTLLFEKYIKSKIQNFHFAKKSNGQGPRNRWSRWSNCFTGIQRFYYREIFSILDVWKGKFFMLHRKKACSAAPDDSLCKW